MIFFPVNWTLLFKHSWIFKNLTGYARMARSAVPKLSWALPKTEFGEHASNNNPSLKQLVKKRKKWLYRWFLAEAAVAKFLFDVSIRRFSQMPIHYGQRQTVCFD